MLHRRLKLGRRPAAGNPLYDQGFSNLKAHYKKDQQVKDRKPNTSGRDQQRRPSPRRPSPRRPRSRSRSRSRERVRKRRSDSPYSVAYDNWKRFKQGERVSLHFLVSCLWTFYLKPKIFAFVLILFLVICTISFDKIHLFFA